MSREEIAAKLIEVMKESSEEDVDWDAITEETEIESLGFDSLTTLDLIFYLKEYFAIEIQAEDLEGITTVAQMVSFVEERIRAA